MFGLPNPKAQFFSMAHGQIMHTGPLALGICSLPTDPIGTTTVTFTGVNAGSEIRVYRADGVELAGVESCVDNQQLTWAVYAPGANSVNRIVVIGIGYKIKEFEYTPSVGMASIPMQQEADKWYSNPV